MSSQKLSLTGTHVSKFKGRMRYSDGVPVTDKGPAGLKAGDMYYDTSDNQWYIYDGSKWNVLSATSTSTSSSTSTTTTTSTSV